MQSIIVLFLLFSVIAVAKSQTWTGTYSAAGSTCSTSACCCFSGTMTISQSSSSTLLVTSGLSGVCSGSSSTSFSVSTPSGYTTTISLGSSSLLLTLSSDSRTITATNSANSACSGSVTKSGTIRQHASIMLLVILLGVALSVSKMWFPPRARTIPWSFIYSWMPELFHDLLFTPECLNYSMIFLWFALE